MIKRWIFKEDIIIPNIYLPNTENQNILKIFNVNIIYKYKYLIFKIFKAKILELQGKTD